FIIFFFQAEDGIRDFHVTGVQTCALPISRGRHPLRVDLPLQDDARTGEDVARALLANRREPHPWPVIGLEATARADLLAAALGRSEERRGGKASSTRWWTGTLHET